MQVQELLETNLLDQMDFDSDEEKNQFLSEYGEILFARIIERVSNVLNDAQLLTITKELHDNVTPPQLLASLVSYVPHLPIIIGEEVLDMKEESFELLQIAN